MKHWPFRSLLRPMGFLYVLLLLAICLASSAHSDPPDRTSLGGRPSAEHMKSLACKDETTGIEFSPLGVTFDIMDDLYVVDSDHSRIYLAGEGMESLTAFTACPREYPDCEFIDLEVNAAGGLYVSERSSGSVLALDRWGELAAYVETGDGVAGIGSGRAGNVVAAMGIEGTVRMVDFDAETGSLDSRVSHEDEDAYPVDCCVLSGGSIVVTDAFSGQILFLSALGELKGVARGFEFKRPFGVTCLEDRLILVSDSDRGVVAAFDVGGGFLFAFGEGILDTPTFLACRADGVVCVSDTGNLTIEVFRIETPHDE